MSHPSSQITSLLVRLGFAIAGALALGLALLTIFIYVGWLMHPGNPEGAQFGILGVVIGLPVGFIVGYLIAQQKRIRRIFLASSIGAFFGGIVGGYAVTMLAGGQAVGAVIGLLFTFVGCAVGWFLAERCRGNEMPDGRL
jgi:hypothetical protein